MLPISEVSFVLILSVTKINSNEQVEVKVKENWRQDVELLKRYGYGGKIQVL